jgi:transcriptional regulator with XRE-family HTH domain
MEHTATINPAPEWTLGDRLTKARTLAGLTVQEMASAIRVSRGTVSNYEHDHTEPPFTTIKRYAELANVSLWWLLGEDTPPSSSVTRGYKPLSLVTDLVLVAA